MDGVSVAVNVIALVTALKDLYDFCKEIRRSFLKIKENQSAIARLKDKLADGIKSISKIIKKYQSGLDETGLLEILGDLKHGLKDLLKKCNHLWSENTRIISSNILRAWWNADEIERKIQKLEYQAKPCYEGMNTRLTMQTACNSSVIIRRLENIEVAVAKSYANISDNLAVPPVRHGFYMSNDSSAVSSSTSLQSDTSCESSASSSSVLSGTLPTYDEYLSADSYQSYLRFYENGQIQAAFDALEITIGIYQRIAKSSSNFHRVELSEYLQQSSRLLVSINRKEEAVERSQNAVEILRQLIFDGLNLDHELAVALLSLSGRLHSVQWYDSAASHAMEALEILTKMNSEEDQLHDPDMPRAHLRLVLIYMDKGEDNKAYDFSVHAVNGMRRLLVQSGSAQNDYAKEFTNYLHSHFQCCIRLGYQQESSNTIKELVETCRLMRKTSSSSSQNEDHYIVLQDLVENASFHYSNGNHNVAFVIYEALANMWRDVVSNSGRHREDFAIVLRCLACCLSKLNQNDEALKTIEEAIAMHEILIFENDRNGTYEMQLARDVSVQADILGNMRQFQMALPSARRAVALYRRLDQTSDGRRFFSSLKLLAQCLSALRMNDELSVVDSEVATMVSYESYDLINLTVT